MGVIIILREQLIEEKLVFEKIYNIDGWNITSELETSVLPVRYQDNDMILSPYISCKHYWNHQHSVSRLGIQDSLSQHLQVAV